MSTVEHRRRQIVEKINDFDKVSTEIIKASGLDIDKAFKELLGRDVFNIQLSQSIAYNKLQKIK